MREFNNKTEQDFLRQLISIQNHRIDINLGDYLAECILKTDRAIRIDNGEVALIFNRDTCDGETFIKDLAGFVSLIEVLKKNDLIFIHVNPEVLKNRETDLPLDCGLVIAGSSFLLKNDENYEYFKIPTTLSEYVLEYINQFVFIRHELIEYVNNKFCTSEQLRYTKTILWTKIAAVIAFGGLIIALFR
jgi:hypothetical protein